MPLDIVSKKKGPGSFDAKGGTPPLKNNDDAPPLSLVALCQRSMRTCGLFMSPGMRTQTILTILTMQAHLYVNARRNDSCCLHLTST